MIQPSELLKAKDGAELKLLYARALAGVRPSDGYRVAPLRHAYQARSRELRPGGAPAFLSTPRIRAAEPEMQPPPKKGGCLRWFWVIVGTYGIIRILVRVVAG